MKIQSAEKFLAIVDQFTPFHDGSDLYWIFYVRVKRKWKQIAVRKYQDVYYVAASERISFSYPTEYLSEDLENELKIWSQQLSVYKAAVLKNPVEAQTTLIHAIPMELRKGLMTIGLDK